jgi:cell division protein FtsW (lipid II flippase)
MLCYGVAVFLFSHVIVNLVGVLGLLPLTGVPLPFLSYGGSFAITVSLSLTVVQRVSIENYNERKRKVLV